MNYSFSLPRFSVLPRLVAFLLTLALFSACKKEDYAAKDEKTLQKYIKDNNLTGAQRQSSGLYVIITQPGTGTTPTTGQTVSALYTGTTLDGKVFDSTSQRNNQAFSFTIGRGQVIKGWDEGFALLNKGAKAILLIPSDLAYGDQAAGSIPAHAVLRFDVELTNIK